MPNEIVKYDNQLNNQVLRKFTPLEIDLFMTICSRMREQGTVEEVFTFEELKRRMSLKKNLTNAEFARLLVSMNRRLVTLNFEFTDERDTIYQFALFSDFTTSPRDATLIVAVNAKFSFVLNDLTSGFTRFELGQFTGLRSGYAKECYRRLRQYRKTGLWRVGLADFRRLLDVPKSYRIGELNRTVLKPIEEELGPLMGLRIHRKYMKTKEGRGRPSLVGFEFEFTPEHDPREKPAPHLEPSNSVIASEARRSLRDAERTENQRKLAKERARHGGSMFIGSKDYRPAEEVPLFD